MGYRVSECLEMWRQQEEEKEKEKEVEAQGHAEEGDQVGRLGEEVGGPLHWTGR